MHTITTAVETAALAHAPAALSIGGQWRSAGNGATLAVEDPSTGTTLVRVPDATPDDALLALDAADAAFGHWRRRAPRERGEMLRRAHDLMIERLEELATLLTLEMGKAIAESRAEVRYAAGFLRWYAEEAVRANGRYTVGEDGASSILTVPKPVGPCVFVTPWNFPLAMGTRKIGPALAAGCTVVVKPAKQTPLSMLALARVFEDVGLPAGVLNVVTTRVASSVIGPLVADPRTRKLSFTGSTDVGRALIRQSADQVLRVSMELGGNAPFVVFEDADVDAAIDGAVVAKMRNIGEACTAADRFYVHESVAERFAAGLTERMGALAVGRGLDPDTDVGPLIDGAARDDVAAAVEQAVDAGARLRTGGHAVGNRGYFYAPTVLTDVPEDAAVLRREIFGPVAALTTFSSTDEVLRRANASEYGLAAYVYTRDIGRALRVCEELQVGMVGLNQGVVSNVGAPFGGAKHSGFGREGGPEGLAEYLETTYIAIARDSRGTEDER